jgi:CxxC motif-containing protein
MSDPKKIICITCPKGCEAAVSKEGDSIQIKGKICKKGKAYIAQEFKEPMRTLTTTVLVEGSSLRRLPVRTRAPIPRKNLIRAMDLVAQTKVKSPIKIGEVVIPNLLGTGVDLIASDDLREKARMPVRKSGDEWPCGFEHR